MTRRLTIDVCDRPHKLVLECYCCRAKVEVPDFGRWPLNWTKDSDGNDRCPRHETGRPKFVTLGDLIEAKRGVR